MLLLCAQGLQSKEVGARLGVHEHTVGKWRRRFMRERIEGLTDEYRSGRPRTVSDDQVAGLVERTLNSTPKDATHWSTRCMAAESGPLSAFNRTGARHSNFPPTCCSSTDREQPVLPMAPGVAEQRTYTYVRHGTTSLFAALDVATGAVVGKCYQRHRATEFLDFLKRLDAAMPERPDVHLVMDNYATHKAPKIKAWLARRPHWHIHFTPTSASCVNQVERWFAELTRKQLQRGVHRSIAELEADIAAFIKAHNENPKPCKWVKSADEILASVKRFCLRTQPNLCDEL